MQSNLAPSLAFIFEDEGGLTLGGSEPGGASNLGISMVTLADWNRSHGIPPPTLDDMKGLTTDLAEQIYTANFAMPIRFNDLPSGPDYRLLDIAVNLGVTGAINLLQLVLGFWPLTGKMDDVTLAAANKMDARVLSYALGAAWLSFKRTQTWDQHGHGWTNRYNRAQQRALAMAVL